ncbi:BTAD domain-containing putative transcriptional regulator [Actinoplanes sp. NPDC048988]|uniref:AfsR/SARP family transcriptional regulator n=1 Tax=Actinoplanes sp. NPDC048988 TaxID=3363901 RepID=UPI00371DF8B2
MTGADSDIRLRLLGPLEVTGPAGPVPVVAPRRRAILAMLLLRARYVVPVDRLIDAVWSEAPPATAKAQVQICISALRRVLEEAGLPGAIKTHSSGYIADVSDDHLDVRVFERLCHAADEAVAGQDPALAATLLQRGLALFRGVPLDGLTGAVLESAAAHLAEQQLGATEKLIDIRLAAGEHRELVGELTGLVAVHPLRERFRGQLMRALAGSGRPAEALEVYRCGHRLSVDELGLEPGPELQHLHRNILEGSQEDRPAAPAVLTVTEEPATPRQLPLDDPHFSGRRPELERLCALLSSAGTPRVAVISGRAGVGKSALAVRAAHDLADAYPDGQLYATLDGSSAHPASAATVLDRFLQALGVPGPEIPSGTDARAAMYRSRTADRRILVVLDDAGNEEQVQPLISTGPHSATVVTSRSRLTLLGGAAQLDLAPLDPAAGLELLRKVAGREPGRDRPADLTRLVELCDGLPLALRIAGARLAARPHWPAADLVSRMANDDRRLDELAHGGLAVRSGLESSYELLAEPARHAFRLLSGVRMTEIASWSAAPLLGLDPLDAEDAVEALVDAQLVGTHATPTSLVRYRLHGLTADYARELAHVEDGAAERSASMRRLLSATMFLGQEAHRRQYGDLSLIHGTAKRRTLPAPLVDRLLDQPMRWLQDERHLLVAAVRWAQAEGLDELCWDLAVTAATLFEWGGFFDDWQLTHDISLDAVRAAGNQRGEAMLTHSIGALYLRQDRRAEAHSKIIDAVRRFKQLGDDHGRALALRNLALLDRMAGDRGSAMRHNESALTALRVAGDRAAEADVLTNMAQLNIDVSQNAEAEQLIKAALGAIRGLDSTRVHAQVMYRYGELCRRQGRLDDADRAFEDVLTTVRGDGDQNGEAYALYGLGLNELRRDHRHAAETLLRRASTLAGPRGTRRIEARINSTLETVSRPSPGRMAASRK